VQGEQLIPLGPEAGQAFQLLLQSDDLVPACMLMQQPIKPVWPQDMLLCAPLTAEAAVDNAENLKRVGGLACRMLQPSSASGHGCIRTTEQHLMMLRPEAWYMQYTLGCTQQYVVADRLMTSIQKSKIKNLLVAIWKI